MKPGRYITTFFGFILLLLSTGGSSAENIKQGDWTKLLVKALRYENSGDIKDIPHSKIIQLLEGIPDRNIEIDRFVKSINNPQIVPHGDGEGLALTVVDPSATVFYFVVVPTGGIVPLSATIKGGAQYWTFGNQPTIITKYQVVMDKVDVGKVKFARGGVKKLGISIPKDGMLSGIVVDSACASPIVPSGGWNGSKSLTQKDLGQTMLQAIGFGDKLPLGPRPLSILVTSKKRGKALGGLKGFDYEYNGFTVKEEGFYSFHPQNLPKTQQTYVIDGCIYKKVIPAVTDEKSKLKGGIFTIFFQAGNHSLKLTWGLDKDPGDILLKKREASFDAIRDILGTQGITLTAPDAPVDEQMANDAAKGTEELARDTEDSLIYVRPPEEGAEEIIKRRSLSPILPEG